MKLDQLEAKVAEMQAEIERLKAEETKPVKLRKRVEFDEPFYYLDVGGDVNRTTDFRTSLDTQRFERGNYYLTREAAEDDLPYVNLMLKLRHLARDLNDGWVPDWDDGEQKFNAAVNSKKGLHINTAFYYRIPGTSYFKTRELAQAALDSLTDAECELIRSWR